MGNNMDGNDNPLVKCLGILSGFLLALILLIILSLGGCSSVKRKYIPMESTVIRTDTVHHTQRLIERDTVTILEHILEQRTDSVAPILDSLGRMVGYDHWRIIDRSASLSVENVRLRAQLDSIKQQGTVAEKDREPYPVEVPVETNVLRWWQKALMGIGITGLITIGLIIAVWIRRRSN
ncbi:MAG: hypothetical protein K2M56_08745 [Muribaculaceae bacterium]|nr:hypothetical protein [Muribaculaceae bacterium]